MKTCSQVTKSARLSIFAATMTLLISACGGGGDAAPESAATTTPSTASEPAATPTPTACTAAPIGSTGYSLVFKGCDATNVATYYDKTECVRDNATGLIWQGQTGPGTGLRANNEIRSNLDNTAKLQKGFSAPFTTPTQSDIDAITNSIGFKNAVNSSNLCGSSAWRLPTESELLSIVKTGSPAPAIDADWFPNLFGSTSGYWTSTPNSAAGDHFAKVVSFGNGSVSSGYREDRIGHRVRLVHN